MEKPSQGTYFENFEAASEKMTEIARDLYLPNWNQPGEAKWFIGYRHDIKEWVATSCSSIQEPGKTYYRTKAQAELVIKNMGEDLYKDFIQNLPNPPIVSF